jgi:hypothetical protein
MPGPADRNKAIGVVIDKSLPRKNVTGSGEKQTCALRSTHQFGGS